MDRLDSNFLKTFARTAQEPYYSRAGVRGTREDSLKNVSLLSYCPRMNQLSKISSAKIQHFSAVCKFSGKKVISPTSVVGLLMEIGILFSCLAKRLGDW